MQYSLRHPLAGLSWLQRLIWPLIFAQLVALKAAVRARYGRGVPYQIAITRFGRVHLVRLPSDAALSYGAPHALVQDRAAFTCGLIGQGFLRAFEPEVSPRAPAPENRIGLGLVTAPVHEPLLDSS